MIQKKYILAENAILVVLFLFSISLFNLAGYIFAALIAFLFIRYLPSFRMVKLQEFLLILFSFFYFALSAYHYGFQGENVILYLGGPWMAYYVGRIYMEISSDERAFMKLLVVLAVGMWLHGVLNLFAYIRSDQFATYEHYRRSVDFWRGELVAVTVTGMYYMFATGLSLGVLFIPAKRIEKVLALGIVVISSIASAFFANRTMLVIVAVVLLWRGIVVFFSRRTKAIHKALIPLVVFAACIIVIMALLSNFMGIGTYLSGLKIVDRFINDGGSGRLNAWSYFWKDFNYLRYPFGGGYMVRYTTLGYLHNLWLDVYNTTGVIPFVLLVWFTLLAIMEFVRFRKTMMEVGKYDECIVFQCLMCTIILNLAVEPIIEANPYYFLIVLMYCGAMFGYGRRLRVQLLQRNINNE